MLKKYEVNLRRRWMNSSVFLRGVRGEECPIAFEIQEGYNKNRVFGLNQCLNKRMKVRETMKNGLKQTIFYRILGALAGIFFILTMIYGIVYFGLARGDFFDSIIIDKQLEENLEIPEEELEYVMDTLISYVKSWDENATPQVQVTVDGVKEDFYVENELVHLKDVQVLMETLTKFFCVILVCACIITLFLWKKGMLHELGYGYFIGLAFVIIVAAIIAIIASDDMYRFVTLFHNIFFSQGGWTFDPAESRIVWFFPNLLYQKALTFLGIVMVAIFGSVAGIDVVLLKKCKKKEVRNEK